MNINDTNIQNDDHKKSKKKCHGNRRDQRFRRKCRARGMKTTKIEKLLNERKQMNNRNNNQPNTINDPMETSVVSKKKNKKKKKKISNQRSDLSKQVMTTNLNKRKRDMSLQELKSNSTVPKSTSSMSIVKPLSKKIKKTREITTATTTTTASSELLENNSSINNNYRRPMYLKRSSSILFQILSKKLNYPFKKKDEQKFIYTRLDLLDQHYCLELDLQLWQSYLDIGLQHHRWPEQLYIMSKTYDSELCEQYLRNYIETIKKQINQYQIELTKQSALYPITISISFDQIDHYLKEFVDCQQKYLLTRNNNQLVQFKDHINESELFEIITTYYPTIDQNLFINQLITIRQKQIEISEEELMLEMRILCKFLPKNFDQLENFLGSICCLSVNNQQEAIQLRNQNYKTIQESKRIWLHIFLSAYDTKLQEYDQKYHEILIQLESLLLNNTSIHGVTLFNDINRYMTYRTNQLKQEISDKMNSFRGKLLHNRQRSSSTKNIIGVSPEPYLDLISNPFNTLEWHHLSLGPSYIRLNQSALRPQKQQEIQVNNEHKDIFTKVENNLVKYHHIPRTLPILKEYSNQLHHYISDCYSTPLTYKDHIQAQEQAQIVASILKKSKQHNLIIRETDKSNNFYIGLASEFEKKVQKYLLVTNAYMELTDNPLDEILNKVIQLLNNLRSKKLILQWQYEKMMPDRKKTKLAHLYFNPKTHKDGIPVRPIVNTIRAATTNISKFLDQIIRPIFDKECKETTIIDGAHLIEELHKYIKKGLFKLSTLFCTFDIHNLYTMLPQDEALDILVEFLRVHGYEKVKGIDLDTIRILASIVLKENVFVYDKKIYRQTMGGAMGSSFTLTLANIFMWKWQKEFVRRQDMTGEFFGRYIDDVFITWNKSEKKLIKWLDDANTWHPNIKLDYKISQSLPFLDVLLTNNNGFLLTSVYHKPSAEPYVVPFISDHPRHVFGNIIQTALTRAVRYSSTFKKFQHERCYIKLMLLYNGYPSSFIDNHFQKFFSEYIGSSSFLPFITDEKQFRLLRHKIMGQLTPRQSQVSASAATANIDNDQTDDTKELKLNESIKKTAKKVTNYGEKLFVHYTHEKRFQPFKRDIHHVYENVFKNTPAMDLKLIVGNRNRPDATNELVRKRPKASILQNKRIKNKYLKFLDRRRKMKKTSN